MHDMHNTQPLCDMHKHAHSFCNTQTHMHIHVPSTDVHARSWAGLLRHPSGWHRVQASAQHSKASWYPHGSCDTPGNLGTGSRVFYLNTWAMIWPTDYRASESDTVAQDDDDDPGLLAADLMKAGRWLAQVPGAPLCDEPPRRLLGRRTAQFRC